MSAPPLSATVTSALQAAVILLRDTRGFMFLPLFADSERAASSGLDFLKSQLDGEFYTVAWPLDRALPLSDQRLQLLGNLDDAIGKLPPDTVIVLDATGSLRHDLALEAIAYVNHRREPLRAGGLRLVLCWPAALKDELLSNAADLWSVRAASPWVEEDLALAHASPAFIEQYSTQALFAVVPPAIADRLRRWRQYRNLKAADLSPRDALDLAHFQYDQLQWASAAELAEAVFFAVEGQQSVSTNGEELIDSLNFLSITLSQLGNHAGALVASKRAVFEAHRLVKTNVAAYEPYLARSLSNQANISSETGDRPGALNACQQAVEIYRRFAKVDSAAYEPNLAASIVNMASFLSATGDYSGALKAAGESVEIYTRLAKTNPASVPNLATAILVLANMLGNVGDRQGALNAAQMAVDLYKELVKTNPGAYEPNLASSVNNLANRLSDIGDSPGALVAAQEAVSIRRRLASIKPAVHEPQLAMSISNLAVRLSETGDRTSALKAAREAVDIRRRLAQTNSAAHEPDLAASLSNLANRLSDSGDLPGALKATQEAVALYEKVNLQTSGAFDRQLAIARRVRDRFN